MKGTQDVGSFWHCGWQPDRHAINLDKAADEADERHLCPLQLSLIERAQIMWSNPGEVVLSPFLGIGSEGVVAMRRDRKFLGIELKPSYWRQACRALESAEGNSSDLFVA